MYCVGPALLKASAVEDLIDSSQGLVTLVSVCTGIVVHF